MAPDRKDVVRMIVIALVAAIVGTFLSLQIDWFPPEGASQAHKIDTLYDWLLIASVPMFVLVMAVAIYCVVRFRVTPETADADGAPIHGHTRLEIVWVTIPFLIVTALAVYAAVVLANIEKKQPNELKITAIGQQFTWHFKYENAGGKQFTSDVLYVPNHRPVRMNVVTRDVLHSFWVPAFRLKLDAVPGQTGHVRFTPIHEARYEVVCAELCGWGHATMRVAANVVSTQAFKEWVQKTSGAGQKAAAPAGGQSAADQAAAGKAIFTGDGGCGACHKLTDAKTSGTIGPDLDSVVADAKKYGKGQSPEAYIKQSIESPDAFFVPGFPKGTMPSDFKSRLGPDKVDQLVQYLLEAGGK